MPTTINSKQDTERALSTSKGLATKAEKAATTLVIADDAGYEKASDQLVMVKGYIRDITKQKKKITDPINEALKETRALFKPIEVKLEAAKTNLTTGMLDYRAKQQAEADAKAAELEAKVDAGEMELDDALAEMPSATIEKTTYGKKGAVTVRTIKDVRVIDASLIPAQYLVIDMVAVRRDALGNAAAGIAPVAIPGVELYDRESL
jgi:hypothetical protein